MYGVNNLNHSPFNYGKKGQPPVHPEQPKLADGKNTVRKDEILFSSVSRKDESYLSSLSSEAKEYLSKLKEMYPDYDFIVADYETDEDASRLLSQGTGKINVLITPDLLEKMATDEATRSKYEDVIAGAADQFDEINANLGAGAKELIKSMGITVNEDGTVNFYANLIKGVTTEDGSKTIKSSLVEDFTNMLNAMAAAREKQLEQRKTEKDDKPPQPHQEPKGPQSHFDPKGPHGGPDPKYVLNRIRLVPLIDAKTGTYYPPAKPMPLPDQRLPQSQPGVKPGEPPLGQKELQKPSMEKLNELLKRINEQIKMAHERAHGKDLMLHPRSFDKYKKAAGIYNLTKVPDNHHSKGFDKLRKEENFHDRKKDHGNLPPESFEKYRKGKGPYHAEEDHGNLPPESFKKYEDEEMNFKV